MSDNIADGSNGRQIDTDDQARHGHVSGGHLKPTTRRGAQIYTHSGLLQKVIRSIKLKKLEGSSGSVAGLFGKLVELVLTGFSDFCFLTHLAMSLIVISRN